MPEYRKRKNSDTWLGRQRPRLPDCPYEFSVLPADTLGQVCEQVLGKVIPMTPSHRAKVEERLDVRRAGLTTGVFRVAFC